MHPIHDVDPLLLLATSLAAKRRPAELLEVMAAIDLINGNIPTETKLVDAFARLAVAGLLVGVDTGIALTPAAETLIKALPRKVELEEKQFSLKNGLTDYIPGPAQPPLTIAAEALTVALLAHRAAAKSTAKNLLVAKPKVEESTQARPGQRQRKPAPARRKKH